MASTAQRSPLHIFLIAAACATVAPSMARAADSYETCLSTLEKDPSSGFEYALRWRDLGGGAPAEHCAAIALFDLGVPEESALRLEILAEKATEELGPDRADILAQAANAWIAAGRPKLAVRNLNSALTHAPGRPDLLVDRGRAFALLGEFETAIEDFTTAISKDSGRPEPFIYRASAFRQTWRATEAVRDLDAALELDPLHLEARLERGLALIDLGRDAEARQEFLIVTDTGLESPIVQAAQQGLEKIDVRVE